MIKHAYAMNFLGKSFQCFKPDLPLLTGRVYGYLLQYDMPW